MSFRSSDLPDNSHIMPSPPAGPWNSEAMPWTITPSYNGVMQFNAGIAPFGKNFTRFHKRKSQDIPPLPSKHFITEEKMAAHLNGLHISSEYVEHNSNTSTEIGSTSNSDISMDADVDYSFSMTNKDLEEKLKNANRITICEEIRKLHQEDSIIPKALLSRVEKPCTAVVLWQPPPKIVEITGVHNKTKQEYDQDDSDDDDKDNNNSSNVDLNCTMETDM